MFVSKRKVANRVTVKCGKIAIEYTKLAGAEGKKFTLGWHNRKITPTHLSSRRPYAELTTQFPKNYV